MLVIVSPAKKLDYETEITAQTWSEPDFLEDSAELIKTARQLTRSEIAGLMKLSDSLADLNYRRFHDFSTPFTPANARPAIYAFKGDTYVGLDAPSLTKEDLDYAQDHLRILSGLYGLLRPLDLMQAYRLEMGCRLSNPRGRNLYDFWGDKLTEALNTLLEQQNSDVLVNCASNEYFKAIKPKNLKARVITPTFKQVKDGKVKSLGMMAKRARGMMARFIIQNRIETPEDLKKFDMDGYVFQPALSDHENFVFHKISQ
ncbi:peroxide stress protein YaaA [Luteithermobacter gelatinilyticus]|uniref:peroxide stress protein YaaA n=1 Tax=Luteithermobacter gelatinilyticus TaxID=2582913 RepID=UPI001106520C|nr:peroxide stress protein YaaA [Luteithermobacter gelatinilyticus]